MERRPRPHARSLPHKTHAKVGALLARDSPNPDVGSLHRVTSSIFSGDARFVLTGSDDGNVRIWKAKASDKLGVVTARERAAMEYRESLKDRWKMDAQVGKVARCVVPSISPRCYEINTTAFFVGHGTYQSLCIRRQNSNERCWMRNGSKRKGEGSTHGLGNRSPSLQGKGSLLPSRLNPPFIFLCNRQLAWSAHLPKNAVVVCTRVHIVSNAVNLHFRFVDPTWLLQLP